jgi:hypothetical protein
LEFKALTATEAMLLPLMRKSQLVLPQFLQNLAAAEGGTGSIARHLAPFDVILPLNIRKYYI